MSPRISDTQLRALQLVVGVVELRVSKLSAEPAAMADTVGLLWTCDLEKERRQQTLYGMVCMPQLKKLGSTAAGLQIMRMEPLNQSWSPNHEAGAAVTNTSAEVFLNLRKRGDPRGKKATKKISRLWI